MTAATALDERTEEHDLLAADALAPGEMIGVRVGRWSVLLVRTAEGWHAINDRCPHAAARLSPGRLRGRQVLCPLHGARFDIASGRCAGAAYGAVRTFPLRVENGRVLVTLPARPPEMVETPLN
ncbi:Rieske (2Fe-2S) protein [Novosphingobium resinovorum]|uniref:Rieske (2Fe-2S) protein n=1 Tax=Novosphingobium resinovorum TaxID=158500 RepID=UPI002ED5DBF4|nr:Rieske 2Fe-2S domain-containing protein [Novosphingobium resinovorum]